MIYSTPDSIKGLFHHIEKKFPIYLEASNLSLCFVFEEVVSYIDNHILKQGQNKDKDERWACGAIKTIRVIVPSPYSKPQIYFAKNGEGIHGQHTLAEIFKDLLVREHFPPHIFIWNNDDYSDNFM